MSNIRIRRSINTSVNVELNPIVMQLQELGYNNIYSRRVFYYLHPEDLEEALNYMDIINGIIQHKFLKDREPSNTLCYLCGQAEDVHLNEVNISLNVINNVINDKDNIEEEEKEGNENISKQIQENEINNNENNDTINNTINDNLFISQNYIKEINKNYSFTKNIKDINININNSIISLKTPNIKIKDEAKTEQLSFETNNYSKNDNKAGEELEVNDVAFEVINTKSELNTKEEEIECEICNELFIPNDSNTLINCGHSFCSSCWFDALSAKIKENKLPSIKCLDYNCQEKLSDVFILNILKSDIKLTKQYKKYQLELEVLTDSNKKLCPYPNCDSYLELKNIHEKDVTCSNNHTFCFVCLKEPHGNLPCKGNDLDKSVIDYAKNTFVKKCPKCQIITEKNKGCNHITCTKCGFQWCWLCNGVYNNNHFNEGKCQGFQFYQPKNDYDIKLVMEGKINANELSNSQRQFDDENIAGDFLHIDIELPRFERINRLDRPRNIRLEPIRREIDEIEERYQNISCKEKLLKTIVFIFSGNCLFILHKLEFGNRYLNIVIYILLSITFFFQMIILNLISLILILICLGFKKFISKFHDLTELFIEKFLIVINNIFVLYLFLSLYILRDNLRWTRHKSLIKTIMIFPNVIMSIIILYPQRLLINIGFFIFLFIDKGSFSSFINALKDIYNDAIRDFYNFY